MFTAVEVIKNNIQNSSVNFDECRECDVYTTCGRIVNACDIS